jgi:hypothetical protein
MSPATVAIAARDAIKNLPTFRSALRDCLNSRHKVRIKTALKNATEDARNRARQAYRDAVSRRQVELGGTLSLRLKSPLPAGFPAFAYRGAVPLRIHVRGGHLGFTEPPPKRRIGIIINGRQFLPPPHAWTAVNDGIALDTELTADNLRRGVNSIECCVTDGAGVVLRVPCLFVFQPGAVLPESIRVDEARSNFAAAPGAQEKLVLVNKGTAAVSLAKWTVLNGSRKALVLPQVKLKPNGALTIVTGQGASIRNTVYWRSLLPIWSDKGDTVILIDSDGVVRFVFLYGGKR